MCKEILWVWKCCCLGAIICKACQLLVGSNLRVKYFVGEAPAFLILELFIISAFHYFDVLSIFWNFSFNNYCLHSGLLYGGGSWKFPRNNTYTSQGRTCFQKGRSICQYAPEECWRMWSRRGKILISTCERTPLSSLLLLFDMCYLQYQIETSSKVCVLGSSLHFEFVAY